MHFQTVLSIGFFCGNPDKNFSKMYLEGEEKDVMKIKSFFQNNYKDFALPSTYLYKTTINV